MIDGSDRSSPLLGPGVRGSGKGRAMVPEDLLRLAWEAEHDGRSRLRDAVLTLAVAESEPGAPWAERCRARLVHDRSDHFFAHFSTVSQALGDPRVVEARERLRIKYPPSRVHSLLLRAGAARGSYTGRVESLDAMIEDLAGPAAATENVRRDAPQLSRGPLNRHRAARPLVWALAYPSSTVSTGLESLGPLEAPEVEATPIESPSADFALEYLTVLLAIAFLLATVQEPSDGMKM